MEMMIKRNDGYYLLREGAIGTFSTSEKATGGHVWFSLSQAERDGQDYIINAEKSFTTSGGQADFYIVQTRTPDTDDPSEISYFIVDGQMRELLQNHGKH